jgi:predicted NAD/FAD-binding protein
MASHSNQALRMLGDANEREREILGAIPYQVNDTILHRDTGVLPKRRLAWAAWNYYLPPQKQNAVAVTYNMNILQSLPVKETYCVTLNQRQDVRKESILREYLYDHPVFTDAGVRAQGRHREISGVNRTSYCGAYWRNGFHEDGVVSALAVCEQFGRSL